MDVTVLNAKSSDSASVEEISNIYCITLVHIEWDSNTSAYTKHPK